MQALFYRSLRVLEHAMSARREYMSKDGQITYGGPDHYARMGAVKTLRDLMGAGRPAPKWPEKKEEEREMTFADLERVIKARRAEQAQ